MDTKNGTQFFEQTGKAKKILVVLPELISVDVLASGLALKLFLDKLGKETEVVTSGRPEATVNFLPQANQIKAKIQDVKSLVVELNTAQKKLDELSYQVSDNRVEIFLKAKGEPFTPEDVNLKTEKFSADLLIILGCQSLEDAGNLFKQNAEIFYEIPKINIDNKPGNEFFGTVNFVEITSTSLAEILAGLFEQHEQQLIDEDIATCLLTGIIFQTNSFQHVQTTPQALLKASRLVELGARQQEIVRYLYKTKPLPLLKLWGRILAKLKVIEARKAAYSVLTSADFEKTAAGEDLLLPAFKEMLSNIFGYRVLGLITQSQPGAPVRAFFAVHLEVADGLLSKQFGQPVKVLEATGELYRIYEYIAPELTLEAAEALLIQSFQGL